MSSHGTKVTSTGPRERAFSLPELLIVISIIAVLSSLTMSGAMSVRTAAKRHQTEALLAKVETAARQFRTDIGFYPKGYSGTSGLTYVAAGYDKGLIELDPVTQLPVTDNDWLWLSGTVNWQVGNGLMASLGSPMTTSEKETAVGNAEAMRTRENERFYHIGDFGNMDGTGLAKPGGWVQGVWNVTVAPYMFWAYVDPVGKGPESLGERELKRIFDHFRFAPTTLSRKNNPWKGYVHGDETPVGTSKVWSKFSQFLINDLQNFQTYTRPRDGADAYRRALRDGVDAGPYPYDSQYDDTLLANAAGVALQNRKVDLVDASVPWRGGYLIDLEPRNVKDANGDGYDDVIDAYGNPLIYVCEGMPAADSILPRTASIDGNPLLESIYWGQSPNGYGTMLLYHPDPDLESANIINATTVYSFVTDRPNSKGVQVRPDAYDISLLSSGGGGNGSSWIFSKYGYDVQACGDPYLLAGTLVPSRMRVVSNPSGTRSGDPYYCLSPDEAFLVEPFIDLDGNGVYDVGESYIDRDRDGSYDATVAPNDIRICAPSGEEREFEVLSAGRDGRFHAMRRHQANLDNVHPGMRRK